MQPQKIAPELLIMLDELPGTSRDALSRQYGHRGLVADHPAKPVRIIVLIDCDVTASFDHPSAQGIRVNQNKGSVRTAFLPLEQLGVLSEEAAVHRIYPSETLDLAMDLAVESVGLPAFRTTTRLTGRDVVIGIVDSGVDPRHPALRGRLLRAWDQTSHGDGVPEGGYGQELTGHALEAELRDPDGHGTHVAGVAAGAGPQYQGVAPEAHLVLVRTDFNSSHVMDGIGYVFRVAADMRRAAVVNLSMSAAPGPCDGRDPLSRKIDELSGPGRIVCCAAGNYGEYRSHAQIHVLPGQHEAIPFGVSSEIHQVLVQGCCHMQDSFAIALQLPDGATTSFASTNAIGAHPVGNGVSVQIAELSPGSEFLKFTVQASTDGQAMDQGWLLLVRADHATDGRVDVWLSGRRHDRQRPAKDDLWFDGFVDETMKIGPPGAAAGAITVASYTTRIEWTDSDGVLQTQSEKLHEISAFSSPGPLLTGLQKPEVAAPGAYIISARSHHAQGSKRRRFQIDQAHAVHFGTSTASAFISGLVALLLQGDANLRPQEIKQLLRAVSIVPTSEPGAFHPQWGYGLPNIAQLVHRLVPI